MAQRIETAENFLRVDKAFKDKDAKPEDYTVIDFGYCTVCEILTACEKNCGPDGSTIYCLKCLTTFSTHSHFMGWKKYDEYITCLEELPQEAISLVPQLLQLRSKENQKSIFDKKLARTLQAKSKELSELAREVSILASIKSSP